ncbi:neurexin protein binding [Homalodisca vitripennis]|nr:neurexin protein binding [Homalodisca vitripennis]
MDVARFSSRSKLRTSTKVTTVVLYLLTVSGSLSAALTLGRIVHLQSGKVQGVTVTHKMLRPVEMYLGVPYATPPTGANRFSPTRSVPPWVGVRMCDRVAPVCPQLPPNMTSALSRMPRGKLVALQRLLPYLRDYSEDCLYLNVYAPAFDEELTDSVKNPVFVFIHGSDDFSSGGGNSFDGRVLSGYTGIVVVTVNYRLGALGFLNLNSNPESRPRVANSGLMDQIAALQWVQQNIKQFGGDPLRVTLAGHGTGAACVHFLAISPAVMPGLFHRIILLSGSALSSWAIVEDPVHPGVSLAHQVNCSSHIDVVGCLQGVTVEEILQADIRPAAFLNAFGPSVDGVVIRPEFDQEDNIYSVRELDVMFGVVTSESLSRFSSSDIQSGFDGSRRDRILRTYVRNAYEYHLPEIFVTIVNEYTDWERTVVHPINTRDATIAALSDAQFVAPVVKTGDYFSAHSRGKSRSSNFFYVFDHQTRHGDYPQVRVSNSHSKTNTTALISVSPELLLLKIARTNKAPIPFSFLSHPTQSDDRRYVWKKRLSLSVWHSLTGNLTVTMLDIGGLECLRKDKIGAVHGEELPYLFGAPLVDSLGHFPTNFTRSEVALSEAFMINVANFVKSGNPNMIEFQDPFLPISKEKNRFKSIVWEQYDTVHQKYMDISLRPKMKNHFRSHHLSIWLQLIPELHRAGMEDVHTRHNRFHNHHNADLYTGIVRPEPKKENATVAEVILPITTMETMVTTCVNLYTTRGYRNTTADGLEAAAAYSSVLNLTIAIGCSLLVLNILIFAAVYYQREKTRMEMKTLEQQKRLRSEQGLKHSTSVILDMETDSPMMVLTHLPSKNGSTRSLVGHFLRAPKSHEYNCTQIPPPPSPPQPSKKASLPTAAISEITV